MRHVWWFASFTAGPVMFSLGYLAATVRETRRRDRWQAFLRGE